MPFIMNKSLLKKGVITLTLAVAVSFVAALSARAQWTYYDVTATNNSATPNTFNAVSGNANDWAGATGVSTDGAGNPLWRFRDTSGPGVPSWGASAFTGNLVGGPDTNIYTVITGLLPSTEYFVRVYAVYPQNSTNQPVAGSRYGAEFSLNGGSTWTIVDNHGSLGPITWVNNSTELGVEQPTVNAGDTRGYSVLPVTLVTDISGVGRVDVRIPALLSDATATDRMNLDGYALMVVPEPATATLMGISLTGLLMLMRRRRT